MDDIKFKNNAEISMNLNIPHDESKKQSKQFLQDWDNDWLSASIKWNIDLGKYNWMKTSPEYNHSITTEFSLNSSNIISSEEIDEKINTDENKTIVFITPHGKKYHCSDCQCIKNRSDLIEITVSQAESKDCTPCGICCKKT